MVVYNNTVMSIGKVVADKRASDLDPKICYHKLETDTADPANKFTVTQTHRVHFHPTGDEKHNFMNIGTKEKLEAWTSSEHVQVLWHLRNTKKGFQPVKPAIYLSTAVVLPPGRCFMLVGDNAAAST